MRVTFLSEMNFKRIPMYNIQKYLMTQYINIDISVIYQSRLQPVLASPSRVPLSVHLSPCRCVCVPQSVAGLEMCRTARTARTVRTAGTARTWSSHIGESY